MHAVINQKTEFCLSPQQCNRQNHLPFLAALRENLEWPLQTLLIVTFEDPQQPTLFTIQHIPPGKNRDMCREGWNESFDKPVEYLGDEV